MSHCMAKLSGDCGGIGIMIRIDAGDNNGNDIAHADD